MISYAILKKPKNPKDREDDGARFPTREQAQMWAEGFYARFADLVHSWTVTETDDEPNVELMPNGRIRFLPGVATR